MKDKLERIARTARLVGEAVAEDATELYGRVHDKTLDTAERIGTKASDLTSVTSGSIMSAVDRATDEKIFKEFGSAVMANLRFAYAGGELAAKQGMKGVKSALENTVADYDARMNEKVVDRPDAVGFWDGFVSTYLNTPAERRPRSQIYKQHAKYGKVAGWATWGVTFSLATLPKAALAMLPLATHAGPKIKEYLNKKIEQVSD